MKSQRLGHWRSWGTAVRVSSLVFFAAAVFSGCATAPSDDYVQKIIDDAMADSLAASNAGTPAAATSVPVAVESVAPVAPREVARTPIATPVPAPAPVPIPAPAPPPTPAPVQPVASKAEISAPVPVVPVAVQPAAGQVTTTNAPSETLSLKPAVPTIQPETVLWVSVEEDPSLNGRYLVNNASAIDFGYVGLVFLSDMTVEKAEAAIRTALEGRYLNRATVSVKIAKASYDQVEVLGAVDMPGEIKIGAGSSIVLNDALRRAGGLRGNRDNARVKIVRGGMRTPFGPAAAGEVYVLSSADGQLQIPEIYLRNNDLAYVFTYETTQPGATSGGGKRVLLLGEVPRRGVVEFAENEPCTLMYLLFKIGGLPRFARSDRIQVVRTAKDGHETTFLINGDALMSQGDPRHDVLLETGDRVIVPARKFAFF